jgi:hypothetical protein
MNYQLILLDKTTHLSDEPYFFAAAFPKFAVKSSGSFSQKKNQGLKIAFTSFTNR